MKILKHRNLLGCLFAVILAMPLIQVGVRCAYTIFNKNAYESYSDEYILEKQDITSTTSLAVGETYYLNVDFYYTTVNTLTYRYFYNEINVDWTDYGAVDRPYYSFKLARLSSTNTGYYVWVYYNDNNYQQISIPNENMPLLVFEYENIDTSNSESGFGGNLYSYIYQVNKLDNAFEYSIYKITQNNNIGDLHFFTWFADLFLDLDNSANALYINFINWYFNYALLVSVVYILFLVLMWFIQFVRKLLEKGMDFGQRGY